ncbi:phosphotransferase [Candidatus Poribacteria bacterium]|nr:phosphotransferase [Candidatus Poribacteria bacterium]
MMGRDGSSRVDGIDAGVLLPLVRQALGMETVGMGEWTTEALGGAGGQVIRLFRGSATDGRRKIAWSLVLKRLRVSESAADPSAQAYWRREADVHESGVLSCLEGGLRAAPCLAIHDFGDEVWLWMPEVQDDEPERWSLARLGLAARQLGQFNAQLPERRAESIWAGIPRQWLRAWHEDAVRPGYAAYQGCILEPGAGTVFEAETAEEVERIWRAADELLDRLELLPQCFCHFDAFRRNLFAVGDTTVAIDWAFAGLGAYGEDLASLVFATIGLDGIESRDLDGFREIAFAEYMTGLREAGWRGDDTATRFAFLAHGCARFSVYIASIVLQASLDEDERAFLVDVTGVELAGWQAAMEFFHSNHAELWELQSSL